MVHMRKAVSSILVVSLIGAVFAQEQSEHQEHHGQNKGHNHVCNTTALPENRVVEDNVVCQVVLPPYYYNTSRGIFGNMTDEDQEKVVNHVCSSSCAGPFNLFLNATRATKGCGIGKVFGIHHHHHQHHRHFHHENETISTTTTTTVEIHPETVAESTEAQQPMARHLRGSAEADDHQEEDYDAYVQWMGLFNDKAEVVNEEQEEEKGGDDAGEDLLHHHNDTDSDPEHHHHHKGGILIRQGDDVINYQPARRYPGLLLGCMRDSKDNKYCSLKRADLKRGDCDFFISCCYGEMMSLVHRNTEKIVAKVEEKCPGSSAYAAVRCL